MDVKNFAIFRVMVSVRIEMSFSSTLLNRWNTELYLPAVGEARFQTNAIDCVFGTSNSGGCYRSLHWRILLARLSRKGWLSRELAGEKTRRGLANTLSFVWSRDEEAGTNERLVNGERKPTVLPAMLLHLYSGHWNNLFRFLITEARSGTPRENANAAEALALLDCRFLSYAAHLRYPLPRIYTYVFAPSLSIADPIGARSYVIYSLWDYFIKKLKPDRKQINGFCL